MLPLLLIATQLPADRAAEWEKEVAAVEARLAGEKPAAGGVVFAGSSSIRLWDLKASFPDLKAVNVGFGGSEVRDSTHFAARLVTPLKPKTVVVYAGDNDIASGRTPRQVADDFAAFCRAVPDARVLFVAIKPSPKRWDQYPRQQEANRLVKAACAADPRLRFVDVVPPMLGADGKPRPGLFVADGLHLGAEGYKLWAKLVGIALAAVGGDGPRPR